MQLSGKQIFLLVSIVLLACYLRLIPLQQHHIGDETVYLQHAEMIITEKANYNEFSFRPPLLPILIAGGFFIWHSAYMASIIVALISASICVALFLLGQRMHSTTAGIFAALLAAVHPLFVTHGRLILTDTLVASLLAFALFFAFGEKWYEGALCGFFAGLAGLMKFTGMGAIPLLFATIFFFDLKQKNKQFLRTLSFCTAFILVFGPYVVWSAVNFDSIFFVLKDAQAIVNAVHGNIFTYLSITLFTFPILLGIAFFFKDNKNNNTYVILSVFWFVAIIAYLMTFPNREVRFGTAALVPWFVIAGIGYAKITHWKHKDALFFTLIILLSAASFTNIADPPINRWKPAAVDIAEHINSQNNISLPIYATSEYPIYGYYTHNQVVVVDGPNFQRAYPRIMPRDGYLIVSKNTLRDPTPGWADSQRELQRVSENNDLILYRYTKN